jgi:hypothetical protein
MKSIKPALHLRHTSQMTPSYDEILAGIFASS